MTRAVLNSLVGAPQINAWYDVDSTKREVHGTIVQANDAYWGGGEFIYCRYNGSIRQFGLCVLTQVFDSTDGCWRYEATEVPNTANLGRTLCVAMAVGVSGDYGWFCVGGIVPVNCSASVAADTAFGITAAGQGGAISNGKQVLNSRILAAGATTKVKVAVAPSGSYKLTVTNSDGWFRGIYLSGTGIAAGTTVTAISPDGREVTLSAATTAVVAGNVTGTYNNATVYYNVAYINRPFAQGQIV